ncbi:hypothetical protein SAMN05421819_0855 [Bryocella elongata]|uniref:Uncharacterized protein n=1 Tax=Bryocella elongata TaxID=863522 RepID=A0A1H5U3N1_9BACT|nr:hypothetical protein SAMN05421819_0855 [Bryocella elongata]
MVARKGMNFSVNHVVFIASRDEYRGLIAARMSEGAKFATPTAATVAFHSAKRAPQTGADTLR